MRGLFAAIVTAAAAVVSALGGAAAQTPAEITVAYFPEWPTANQVAQAEKWYDEEMGVKLNWRPFETGTAMAEAMVAGEVQIAYSMGAVPFTIAVSEGAPLKTVGVAVSYAENDNCVVHNRAAIDKANARALEGKKVAVPFGTVTHYKLLRTLEHLGVDAGKVEMVDMVSVDGAAALARREVTMACGWGGALRRMTGHGRVLLSAQEQERIGIRVFDVIAVTNDFAGRHPDLVVKFLQVTDDAIGYLKWNPNKAKPVIAEAAGMELKESNIVLYLFEFPRRNAQLSERWMGGTVQTFTKEVADFYVKQGRLAAALGDYGPTIDASFYEKVE